MKGVIEHIYDNASKAGGKKYWALKIDGDRYTNWNPELMIGLRDGMEVEYSFQQKGRFKNITEIKPVETQEPDQDEVRPRNRGQDEPRPGSKNQVETSSGQAQAPEPEVQKARRARGPEPEGFLSNDLMANMTSLKYATQTTQNLDGDPVSKASLTLEIAEAYRSYMRGERYKEKLEAMWQRADQKRRR